MCMLCAQQPVVLWGLHCARNGPASCAELVPYFACARRQRQEAIAKRADAKLATVSTVRNWRTVNRLSELMHAADA